MLSGKQQQQRDLSASHEHYLRAIWEVRARQGYARLTDVARELGVAPATLSVGLRGLEAKQLVAHDPHRLLILTPAGERVARQVHHRFAVVAAFLHDVLGVTETQAHGEACLLEHVVSADTAERLLDMVKLMHEDGALRENLRRRLSGFRRACGAPADCSTCDLACLS